MPGKLHSLTQQLNEERALLDAELQKYVQPATIMFVDIVGSTPYFEKFGDVEGFMLVRRFHYVLSPLVERNGGVVIKTIGDAILAQFPKPADAVRSAIAMQRAMAKRSTERPEEHQLRIRAGINMGMVLLRNNDVFGDVVNVAARVIAEAEPDGILISPAVYAEVHQTPGITIGKKADGVLLKGKAHRLNLYEVRWREGLEPVTLPRLPSDSQVNMATGNFKDLRALWEELKNSGRLPATEIPMDVVTVYPRMKLAIVLADGSLGEHFPLSNVLVVDNAGNVNAGSVNAGNPPSNGAPNLSVVARFTQIEDEVLVEDCGSRQGVFVRLRQPHNLVEGDVVIVGRQHLRFQGGAKPCLIHLDNQHADLERYPLGDSPVSFGRARGTHVFDQDRFMSGTHARALRGPSGFILEDLNSTNGTFVRIRETVRVREKATVLAGDRFLQVVP